ncbi:MAG: flagellar export chaperone FlgN [Spirochaetia bacterium]
MDTASQKIIQSLKNVLQTINKNISDYLTLLKKEQHVIQQSDPDNLAVYIDMERRFNHSIDSCNKSLESWKRKYNSEVKGPCPEIDELTARLEQLKQQALKANRYNNDLVKDSLKSIKKELDTLTSKTFHVSSPYKKIGTPKFIDISS